MKRLLKLDTCTRRRFLQHGAWAAAGLAAFPNLLSSRAYGATPGLGANDRINIGVIGLGGRGMQVMHAFMAQPDTRVVAVCDVFADRRERGRAAVNQAYRNEDCGAYRDLRELLARPDIDGVLIATGDNWHAAASLLAARAGKDIFCEKPMSVALTESRAVADTMKRLGRIYQCGTQRRSISHFRFAAELALSGKLGRLTEMHAEESRTFQTLYDTVLPGEPAPPPEEFDWDLWLGPAQWRPYNPEYPRRNFWSAHLDFSGGSITEWGSHTVDICQWANGTDHTGPVEYWREGDRYLARYADGVKLIIRTGLRFGSCPVRIVGEEGWVETGDTGEIDAHPKSLLASRWFEGGYPPANHVRAFLDCMKTRAQPASNAEASHRSLSVCQIANLCKRLDRPMTWDPEKEQVVGDPEAQRLLSRAYREPWYL